ncbi:MAG: GNAT family N-acetyltransferase [Hydrogenophaga sp.]|nr:GNAT family N-acetyltransferase [Hydrogenophaga sp.]
MKKTNFITTSLLTMIVSCSSLLSGMGADHANPKKHLLALSPHSVKVDQPTDTTHKKTRLQEEIPPSSSLTITRYTPKSPIEHDHAKQYGLQILAHEKQIGQVTFELFPEENDDESEDESDADSTQDTKIMHGEITYLFVEKSYRGGHLGEQLLNRACALLKSKNCQKIMLTAAPEEPGFLGKLVHFYEKAGFQLEDKAALSQFDPQETNPAIPMYKTIT